MTHTSPFDIRIATREADILGAQRLRYEVFVEELGGDGEFVDHARRLERDVFDAHTDQLVLIDPTRSDAELSHVVGVYRLMRPEHHRAAGRYYTETEYDLAPLKRTGRRLLELGRSCLARDCRGGAAMFQLWQGLVDYVHDHEVDILFGVASFHGTDLSAMAHPLSHLHHTHLAPEALRPRSRAFQSMDILQKDAVDRPRAMKETPALIKAYLRLGGMIGEGAFVDHAFNTVDICLVLDTDLISDKHRALYSKGRV